MENRHDEAVANMEQRIQEQMMCIMQAMQNIRMMATEIRNDVRRQDTEISNNFIIMRRRRARIIRAIQNGSMRNENQQNLQDTLVVPYFPPLSPPLPLPQTTNHSAWETPPNNTQNMRQKKRKTSKSPLTTIVLELCNDDIQSKKHECPICYVKVLSKSLAVTNCQHNFCNNCITKIITTTKSPNLQCPLCRTDVVALQMHSQKNYEQLKKKQQKIIDKLQTPV